MEKCQFVLLLGLVSDGGVHSHISHLFALLRLAKKNHISKVWIHVVTDGRDTSPISAPTYVKALLEQTKREGIGEIATISGRFYAMDRDNRWERTQKAYEAIVKRTSEKRFADPFEYIQSQYEQKVTDEFLLPAVSDRYRGASENAGISPRSTQHCLLFV